MVVDSNQETPLPLCIGVMMHANMPKKEIDDRTVLGLSHIRSDKCNCERIQTVCPFSLKTVVFNKEQVDKIDQNTPSTSAICFHAPPPPPIALIQHPNKVRQISKGCVWEQAAITNPVLTDHTSQQQLPTTKSWPLQKQLRQLCRSS